MRRPLRLYGRSSEIAVIEGLLTSLRDGRGGALVLAAPPGLGRSALARHTMDSHHDGPVLYAAAAPAEQHLPHSGLHQLLCSGAGLLPDSPPLPSADVLSAGFAPTALLDLLRTLGAHRPLLVCVDDAHAWDRDSSAALGFVARRLASGARIAVLITMARRPSDQDVFGCLPALRLDPLDDAASTALLDGLTADRIDPAVREELRRRSAGNPRILTCAAERLTADQLAGRAPLPHRLPGAERVVQAYATLLDALPDDTRTALLFASAAQEHEPPGAGADCALLWRAAQLSGELDPECLEPAEQAGLIHDNGVRVHFTHPLINTALLRRIPPARRRAVHHLLAGLLDGPHRTLPRLVQRACATSRYDPALADALARAAAAPRPHADRAVALARSALLCPEGAQRGARFAAAAEHACLGGDPGRARDLLAQVRVVPPAGHVHYVRGLLALRDGPVADARETLLAAAALLAPRDERRAAEALLGAAEAAWAMGDAPAFLDAMSRVPAPLPDLAAEAYRAGMCAVFDGRGRQGRELLRRCLPPTAGADDLAALLRAGVAALVLGEVDMACRTGARALVAVRSHGPEFLLPQTLEHLAYGELRAGRHTRARAHASEGLRAAHRLGQRNQAAQLRAVLALVASVEGGAAAAAEHAASAAATAGPHGLVQAATLATWAVARADLAEGRSAEAAARLFPLVGPGPLRGHFAARMLAAPCLVEAAVLSGRAAEVAGAVDEFAVWTTATADPQAPAQLARCRALLAPAHQAAAHYEEALAHHARAGGDFEGARTRLLYGQWLRRQRKTREARGPLRDALVAFERCGAGAWAERAAGELRAAGETVAGDTGTGLQPPLTAQQLRIARYVAQGATNREVAARLSVSPRTVDHHLRNVFAALGVRSRLELARLLDREEKGRAVREGTTAELDEDACGR
ncbi:LuxR C-terminal-related transcriptional regulator [Streptomyces hypolithicus]